MEKYKVGPTTRFFYRRQDNLYNNLFQRSVQGFKISELSSSSTRCSKRNQKGACNYTLHPGRVATNTVHNHTQGRAHLEESHNNKNRTKPGPSHSISCSFNVELVKSNHKLQGWEHFDYVKCEITIDSCYPIIIVMFNFRFG